MGAGRFIYFHAPMTKYLYLVLLLTACNKQPVNNTPAVVFHSKALNDSISVFIKALQWIYQ
jgi:hypothetical protein